MANEIPRDDTVEGTPRDVVTSQAPRSNLSGGEVAQPYQEFGRALNQIGGALSDVAVPLAERAAAEDLTNQKVTRDAQGQIQVLNPASNVVFGDAGKAYSHAVAAGTVAQIGNQTNENLNDLHAKFIGNPAGFKTASDAYLAKIKSEGTNPVITEMALRQGAQLQAEHYDNLVDQTAKLDVVNAGKNLQGQIDIAKDTMMGLANQGITSGPQWEQAKAKFTGGWDALGANPLYKMPPEQVEYQKNTGLELLKQTAFVSNVDEIYNRKGKAEAQQQLEELRKDPNLKPTDADRLYHQGLSRLEFLTGDQKATIAANAETARAFAEGLQKNTLKAEDPIVATQLQQFRDAHDPENLQKLRAAAQAQLATRHITNLPNAQQMDLLGLPNPPQPGESYPSARQTAPVPQGSLNGMHYDPRAGTLVSDATGRLPTEDEAKASIMTPAALARGATAPVDVIKGAILGQESSNRDFPGTSVTGAQGPGQVEPGTFAQYAHPGEKIDNPADNRAVSARIIEDYSQRYNGDPGRIAVAYFSGPGNVSPLGSPTPYIRDAKDPTGKSTSAYVDDVIGRLSGGAQRAPISSPFTQAQIDGNKYLLSDYVKQVAADKTERLHVGAELADGVEGSFKNGIAPRAQDVAQVFQAAAEFPDDKALNEKADRIRGFLAGDALNAALPVSQVEAYKNNVMAQAAGADIHTVNTAIAMKDQIERGQKQFNEHPMTEAVNRGWIPPQKPIDPKDPNVGAAISQRGDAAIKIGARSGNPSQSVFDPSEVPAVKSALSVAPVDQQLAMLAPIAALPDQVRAATFKQLGDDKEARVFSVAGNLTAEGDTQAARDVLAGNALMKQNPKLAPDEKDRAVATFASLPTSSFADGLRSTVATASEALYAKKAADAGGPQTSFNQKLWDDSINQVTGGVVDYKGSKVIVPTRGMSDNAFSSLVKGLSDGDLADSRLADGKPLSAGQLQPSMFGSQGFRLESYGPGHYLVFSGPDNARAYVRSQAGGPFILDLGKKVTGQTPPPAAPAPPGGWGPLGPPETTPISVGP